MPQNKTWRLSAALIESAHDFGIAATWPGIEPVQRGTCINVNLLWSAEESPYMELFGEECYPTIDAKAAYLFYHLTTGHIFNNGNKRTALICLDAFLMVNSYYLALSNDEVYDLAKYVATSGQRGERFPEVFQKTRRILLKNMVPFRAFRKVDPKVYRMMHRRKWAFRNWEINQPQFPLQQR